MLLSLIIPVYRVEKYIEQCLESVCRQVTNDMSIEVLIINDGSPDNSINIAHDVLLKYEAMRSKFKIIDKQNGGISSVRNLGIKLSKGRYISFLDSDDYMSYNYFESILGILEENEPDLVQFNSIHFDEAGVFKEQLIVDNNGFFNMDLFLCEKIFKDSSWFPWLRVYKRQLFDNLEFPEGRNYEDAYLIPKIILRSKNIYMLDEPLIFYRKNINGITQTLTKENLDNLEWVVLDMIDNINHERCFSKSSFNLMIYLFSSSFDNESFLVFYNRVNNISKNYIPKIKSEYNLSYKMKFFCLFPFFYSFLISIKNKFKVN